MEHEEQILAQLVKVDGEYHVIDQDGTMGPACTKVSTDGYLILTPNASNRKCINKAKADAYFAENPDGSIGFTYKTSRPAGSCSVKIPNEKLIKYLPEELQAEYKDIVDRAIAAKMADKKQPMTELEKAQKAYEKALAKLEALKNND